MKESLLYYGVKIFGRIIRALPLSLALGFGRFMGMMAYYFDLKHKSQAYSNIKMAFSKTKTSKEIKVITKNLFRNYGQNAVELLRMPLLTPKQFEKYVTIEGKENITESLKLGKGVILLAMHFGSWEMASVSCAMFGHPYKVIVKPQKKYSRLDDLLNTYRECGGSVVISRGMQTRDFIKSLKDNEIIGMVVDQGGRDGVLVPFFDRQAAMSVGAIRMGLKWGVPLCFSIIVRENAAHHRMIFQKPLELDQTGDLEKDLVTNLEKVARIMEGYIQKYPSEYMWFYKIWKYSKQASIMILADEKTGHLRQSEMIGGVIQKALMERSIDSQIHTIEVKFRNALSAKLASFLSWIFPPFFYQGRLYFLKWLVDQQTYERLMSVKADFVVSCGSSVASINNFVSQDYQAKSIAILKPGLLPYHRFDWVILPEHDVKGQERNSPFITVTRGAPNLINEQFLNQHKEALLSRYSHLKNRARMTIGLLFGGDAKDVYISEQQTKVLIQQLKEVLPTLRADLLITTSRRTSEKNEQLLWKAFKKDEYCPLLIVPQKEDVPEALGGILGLSDMVIVSGDSISMISEAASSGKNTIVFLPQMRDEYSQASNKHKLFIHQFNKDGYILSTDIKELSSVVYGVAKGKMLTRKLDDDQILLEAARRVI